MLALQLLHLAPWLMLRQVADRSVIQVISGQNVSAFVPQLTI